MTLLSRTIRDTPPNEAKLRGIPEPEREYEEDIDDIVKEVLMQRRRTRPECNFAADWTLDDLNRMTAEGLRRLP